MTKPTSSREESSADLAAKVPEFALKTFLNCGRCERTSGCWQRCDRSIAESSPLTNAAFECRRITWEWADASGGIGWHKPAAAELRREMLAAIDRLASLASPSVTPALQRFGDSVGLDDESPLERLRAFCSLAMNGQDWLDVEPFFDALSAPSVTVPTAHPKTEYDWPRKRCPCGGNQRFECQDIGCLWERDPSLVPVALRRPWPARAAVAVPTVPAGVQTFLVSSTEILGQDWDHLALQDKGGTCSAEEVEAGESAGESACDDHKTLQCMRCKEPFVVAQAGQKYCLRGVCVNNRLTGHRTTAHAPRKA